MIEPEYKFTDEEWKALPFNVKDATSGYSASFAVMERFKELKAIKEFNEKVRPSSVDKDKVIAYIILLYSPSSPLHKIPDIVERKKTAALEAEMEVDENTHKLGIDYEDILYGKNPQVNGMIIAYLRRFKSNKWALLCAGNESFYLKLTSILNLNNTSDSKSDHEIEKIRGDLFKQAEQMESSLSKLTDEFLTDNSPYLRDDLFSYVEKKEKVLLISPELRHGLRSASIS